MSLWRSRAVWERIGVFAYEMTLAAIAMGSILWLLWSFVLDK